MEGLDSEPQSKQKKVKAWLKKIGLAGFLFFLIKGLVWVAIFLGAGKFFGC